MKKTIFLHVGHPKTGSSSLQKFLTINKEALEKQGYSYPACPSGRPNHHFLFLAALNFNKKAALRWQYKQSTLDHLALLNKLFYQSLKELPTPNIILSHECFIYRLDKMLDYFLQDFNVVVIAYFRRMDNFVESFYSELVTHGSESLSVEEHINQSLEHLYMSRYEMIEIAEKKLGQENVIIRPFERGQLKNQDISLDFLTTLGIENTAAFKSLPQDCNPGLPTKVIHFNRLLARAFHDRNYFSMSRKVNAKFKTILQQSAKNKKDDSLLSYEQRMQLIEQTKQRDEEIARRYLKREHGILFYEKLPNTDLQASQSMLSPEEIAELLADFMLLHPPLLEDFMSGNSIDYCYDMLLEKAWAVEQSNKTTFEELIPA